MASLVSADMFESPVRRIAVGLKVLNVVVRAAALEEEVATRTELLEKRPSVPQSGYILIVESDDLIRDLLESWLGEAGYRVVTKSSAAPALREAPSLIIANVPSPRGASALIRPLQEAYAAPILAVSARFRRGLVVSKDAARRLRVRKVLPKPFTRSELLGAVRECLTDK